MIRLIGSVVLAIAWLNFAAADSCIPNDVLNSANSKDESSLREYYGKIACAPPDDDNNDCKSPSCVKGRPSRRRPPSRRRSQPRFLSPRQLRIINGKPAGKGQWPWMVSLDLKEGSCGGALLNKRFVVTAKHCTEHSQPGDVQVTAGTIKLNPLDSSAQKLGVSEIYQHPTADISILKLSNDATLNADVWPIWFKGSGDTSEKTSPLWGPNHKGTDETGEAAIAGWGRIKEGDDEPGSNDLVQATIKLRHDKPCVDKYPTLFSGHDQYCAGGICNSAESNCQEKDTCQGDSGGPLMYFVNEHWILLGVTSGGEGCARIATPGFYVWTNFIQEWIEDNIRI